MRGKRGTRQEEARKDAMRDFGCIACHLDGKGENERYAGCVDIHHMLSGNKKIGEAATVPLCQSHHVGFPVSGMSWHQNRRRFREKYGEDLALIETTNETIREFAS